MIIFLNKFINPTRHDTTVDDTSPKYRGRGEAGTKREQLSSPVTLKIIDNLRLGERWEQNVNGCFPQCGIIMYIIPFFPLLSFLLCAIVFVGVSF